MEANFSCKDKWFITKPQQSQEDSFHFSFFKFKTRAGYPEMAFVLKTSFPLMSLATLCGDLANI